MSHRSIPAPWVTPTTAKATSCKDDVFIRSPLWAGLLRSTGSGFDAALVQEERVGAWPLNHYDAVQRGRFSGIARDEIFTYHPAGWTAVLTPSASGSGLALAVTAAGFRSLSAR